MKKKIKRKTKYPEFSAYEILEQLSKSGGYRIILYEIDGKIHNYLIAYQGEVKK